MGYYELTDELLRDTHVQFVIQYVHYPSVTLGQIKNIVDEYQDRMLEDYEKIVTGCGASTATTRAKRATRFGMSVAARRRV